MDPGRQILRIEHDGHMRSHDLNDWVTLSRQYTQQL